MPVGHGAYSGDELDENRTGLDQLEFFWRAPPTLLAGQERSGCAGAEASQTAFFSHEVPSAPAAMPRSGPSRSTWVDLIKRFRGAVALC